ncbi:hypothetical protein E1A91_D08G263900v1 [Gossypium mustelinum]|uniref:Uncharacterized protein n=1 Tax=Gossypium mustelinum TaxID=34275 RepID=A0A5D2U2H0_GOSMU|nr:hypothetical protein E1A91_D08G263900v1 [Gossypium mustelinum]
MASVIPVSDCDGDGMKRDEARSSWSARRGEKGWFRNMR